MIKTLFIINPASAHHTTLRRWEIARPLLLKSQIQFDEVQTSGAGDATDITKKAIKSGVKRIIAVGGDGTLNEVVNGYFDETGCPIHTDAAIGLLPSGTG